VLQERESLEREMLMKLIEAQTKSFEQLKEALLQHSGGDNVAPKQEADQPDTKTAVYPSESRMPDAMLAKDEESAANRWAAQGFCVTGGLAKRDRAAAHSQVSAAVPVQRKWLETGEKEWAQENADLETEPPNKPPHLRKYLIKKKYTRVYFFWAEITHKSRLVCHNVADLHYVLRIVYPIAFLVYYAYMYAKVR